MPPLLVREHQSKCYLEVEYLEICLLWGRQADLLCLGKPMPLDHQIWWWNFPGPSNYATRCSVYLNERTLPSAWMSEHETCWRIVSWMGKPLLVNFKRRLRNSDRNPVTCTILKRENMFQGWGTRTDKQVRTCVVGRVRTRWITTDAGVRKRKNNKSNT